MLKKIGIILLIFIGIILFVTPARNYVSNLFYRDKDELIESQVIGTLSGYNPHLKEIQNLLEDLGFEPGPADGRIGAQTRGAIKEFQKTKGFTPTGKIDSKTWASLNSEGVSQKSSVQDEVMSYRLKSKDRIRQIQIALKKAGFYKSDIDGRLGPQTEKAITSFQKSRGLNPDGIIGLKTWGELSKFLNDQ